MLITSYFMKNIIYYDEMCVPEQIRILSEKLCLDHTFTPGATFDCIGYDDLYNLIHSNLIDSIYISFTKGTAYYQDIDGSLLDFPQGWQKIKPSDFEMKKLSELNN